MKKLLSIMFAFLLIFSCFVITAFAEDVAIEDDFNIFDAKEPIITFSEDFKKMHVDDEPYSRIDTSMLLTDFSYNVLIDEEYNSDYYTGNSAYVDFSDEQKSNVNDILIQRNAQNNMYHVELYFKDGSTLTVTFLKDSYLEEYNNFISSKANEYRIDFLYPDGNIVIAEKSALFGETADLTRNDIANLYDIFSVSAQNSDGSLFVYTGDLIIIDGNFYYIDYEESDIEEIFWYDEMGAGVLADCIVHKITDEKLLADLQAAEQRYYDDDYGVLYDDNATDVISAVFLIFVFAVIPAVILVIFLIKTIRGKGVYKKIYGTVAALCVAELIVFTIIAVIISSFAPASDSALGASDGEEYIVMGGEFLAVDTDYSNEEVRMLKEAVYCGDGGCTDGCNTGYFYRGENCSEETAMATLELGEPDGLSDEYFGYKTLYRTSFEENIVVDTTEYENGYIVEYMVIGVG